jgi:hypothetical protein
VTTFEELIRSAEVEEDQAIKRRERALAEVKLIHTKARQDARARLTEAEDADVAAAMQSHENAERDLVGIRSKLGQLKAAQVAETANTVALETRDPNPPSTAVAQRPSYDRVARVGTEARTYRPDTDPGGRQFLLDVARRHLGMDVESEYRLAQHMREERVERAAYYQQRAAGDAIVSAFSGLVVPQYLTDMVAPAVAGLRPFADICNKHPLPTAGMTFNISKITTATSAALQATELTAVSATSIDDTLLPISVQTAAGQQLMSRQAIERGTGTEDVTVQDLYKRYATVLDSTLINQASTGLTNVAQNVAYTDTTPTAAELWPKIHNALANQEAALLAQATPTHVMMHSRRWYWLQSQVGTSWPFIAQPGIPTQAGGINLGVGYAAGSRGVLPNGMPVVVDNNISTTLGAGTEDEVYTVAASECHLWEDAGAPTFIRAEQPSAASLGVLLVLYGYFAYTHNRYTNGQSKISGTGLIAPVF